MNFALLLICLWILPFVDQPWLVVAPIALFGAFGIWGRNVVACFATGAWLAYGGWEVYVTGWPSENEALIRTDLLVIAPALLLISATALTLTLRRMLKRPTPDPRHDVGVW